MCVCMKEKLTLVYQSNYRLELTFVDLSYPINVEWLLSRDSETQLFKSFSASIIDAWRFLNINDLARDGEKSLSFLTVRLRESVTNCRRTILNG